MAVAEMRGDLRRFKS